MLMHLLIAFILLTTGMVSYRLRQAEKNVVEQYRAMARFENARN